MSITIPFFALDRQFDAIRDEVMTAVEGVFRTGRVLQGPNVAALEARLAELHEVRHCVAVGSGTDALIIALKSLGLSEESRVAIPATTFVATAEAITANHLKPVFVDTDPATMMVDLKALQGLIESRAIDVAIVVPLYGQMLPAEEVANNLHQAGIPLVEDAAQALGATRFGKPVGHLADITCLSFDPTKPIGAYGSGGAILTNQDEVAQAARELRYHGQTSEGIYGRSGFNFQIDEVQAAIINVKLKHMETWQRRRQEIADSYRQGFMEVPGVRMLDTVDGNVHTYHKFVILASERDRLQRELARAGIQTKIHYKLPVHKQPCFADQRTREPLPVSEKAATQLLSLPIYPELHDSEVELIIEQVRKIQGV